MAMDPLSWDGWYCSEEGAEWVEATLWIEDDHIGIGLTRSWSLERPIPMVDIATVHAVGRGSNGSTSIEVALGSGRLVGLRAPKPFVDLLIRTLTEEAVVAVTAPADPPTPTAADDAPSPFATAPVASPSIDPGATRTDEISCIDCGEVFTTLDEMRTHASKHLPTVEFVPLAST